MSSPNSLSGPRSLRSPKELSTYLLGPRDFDHTIASLELRQRLIKIWNIPSGAKILEIGQGQGDFTVTLADAVGPTGRVVAVDPAPPDYGTPDVQTAQKFLLKSPMGERIEFVQGDPIDYLTLLPSTETFDFIVFCHSVWYFSHPGVLEDILRLVRTYTRAPIVLIAEHSLSTSQLEAVPHVLASLAVNALESFHGVKSRRNIRTALTRRQIVAHAQKAGWAMTKEEVIAPGAGQIDGKWEVRMALASKFFDYEKDVEELQVDLKVKSMLLGLRDAVAAGVAQLDGGMEAVRNMDVWVAKFQMVGE